MTHNNIFHKSSAKNIPIHPEKSVRNNQLVHNLGNRHYIKRHQVKELCENNYSKNGNGITIQDVMVEFRVNKSKAQRTMKHLHTKRFLFTADDLIKQRIYFKGFKRVRPQKYYLTEMKARIIEDNKNNVHNDTTGIGPLEQQKTHTFFDLIAQLAPSYPSRYVHKLQTMTRINKEHYSELSLPTKGRGKAKYRLERINQAQGHPDLEYNIYPNGTVMTFISCSGKPFRLVEEDDIFAINSYLGKVEDRLKNLLSDTHNMIVQPVSTWILTGCDINRDIQVDHMARLTGLSIQVKSAMGVFRGYVKRIEDKVVYRVEQSMTPNESVSTAFETLRKEVRIDIGSLSL